MASDERFRVVADARERSALSRYCPKNLLTHRATDPRRPRPSGRRLAQASFSDRLRSHDAENPASAATPRVARERQPRAAGERAGRVTRHRLAGIRSARRSEVVRDGGRLEPVRRAELAQDVRDVDARRLDADDERRGDLAVGVAAGDEGQDLRLARRQAEDLLQALRLVRRLRLSGDARSSRARWASSSSSRSERPCSDPSGDGVRLAERHARLGARRAGGDERLGLAPAAVGREGRAFEPIPSRCGVGPRLRSWLAARTLRTRPRPGRASRRRWV